MRRRSRERLDELSERKADVIRILSKWSSEEDGDAKPPSTSSGIEELCPIAPPLEDFMRLPSDISRSVRIKRFFEDVRQGDILYGVVSSKLSAGLNVHILASEWSVMARSLDDLRIKAFCPSDRMPTDNSRQNPVDFYVRMAVFSVLPSQEKITLSLSQLDTKSLLPLGLVTRDELPKYYRQISHDPADESDDVASYVRGQREFHNPAFLELMRQQLEVSNRTTRKKWHSLLPGYCGKQIKLEDTPEELTAVQSARWSMKSVEEGIKLMKDDSIPAALNSFNKAVEMNKKNVEAFVARGALYARKEDFHRAIRDFEDALKLNRNHRNARKYLADTFFHLGKKFEKEEPDRAKKFFKDALHLDPKFQEAMEADRRLTRHRQAVTKEVPEKAALSSTAERLRKMLHHSDNTTKSSSHKRPRRTSQSPSLPDPLPDLSEKHLSDLSDLSEKQAQTRILNSPKMSETASQLSALNNGRGKRDSVGVSRERGVSREKSRPSPKPRPVHVDVEDVEAQLEAFRAAKKAQLLATNKDIHKRTFL